MTSDGPGPSRARRAQWLATAFATGAVIMALELVAFRLYAPYFGYSTYVWGSMIGVVMIALAAGYALGGWAADRGRTDAALYAMVLGAGAWQAGVLLVVSSLMTRFARMDAMVGPLLATLVIFAPPMTLLAVTGPFVTRLLARTDRVGTTAGRVYAIATVGSILGVFGTSFGLVPWVGTRATLIIACALSTLVGALGLLVRRSATAALALVPLIALRASPALGWTQGTVWLRESPYNLVRVLRRGDAVELALNDAHTVQSLHNGAKGWTGRYYDQFALGPLLVAPTRRVLVLGMGAGTSLATTRATAPDATIDAVEIDGAVVEAARRYFGLETGPRLHAYVADARPWLAAARGSYDLVEMDLFQGGLYAPFYLVTEEAFRAVRAHLEDDGALLMNVYDGSPSRALLMAIAATMRRVFPTVVAIPAGRRNHVVVAFARPRSLDALRATLRIERPAGYVRDLALDAADALVPLEPGPEATVFTDDRAPVEALTRAMIAQSTH